LLSSRPRCSVLAELRQQVSFQATISRRKLLKRSGLAASSVLAASYVAAQAQTPVPPTVRFQVPDIALKRTVRGIRDQFFDETGVTATIRITPAENVLFAVREDIRTGSNALDGALTPMWHIGDLLADGQISPLDRYVEAATAAPNIDLDGEFPAVRRLRYFDGELVATPFDGDCLLLYYRSDLLDDTHHQRAFEQLNGRPLEIPATWDDLILTGEYFRSEGFDTMPLHLRDGGQGMFQYLSVAGSHVIGEQNPDAFWFDPDSFDPLIESEGHVVALYLFRRLFDLGPAEQLEWTLADAWQHFLDGHAVFAIASADLLTLAIDIDSPQRAQIGIVPLPGTNEYVDPVTGTRHEPEGANITGNALGANWGGIIRTSSQMPEEAYHFLALLAATERQRTYGWDIDDGIDPSRLSQLPQEVDPQGETPIDNYLAAGFTGAQAIAYTSAIQQTLSNPLQLPYLRIPGAFDYMAVLDRRISAFLGGETGSPEETLALVSDDFQSITGQLGIERQLDFYRRSLR
jgi:multiple sugar transport system substrate-binding protein